MRKHLTNYNVHPLLPGSLAVFYRFFPPAKGGGAAAGAPSVEGAKRAD
ncbi:hypothetical protein [Neolewinella aurantiaca]|nr:hypothetical protein [Neolewinella aurantiaca]